MMDLVTFVSAVLFLATGYIPGGDHAECATGTVVAISEEMAVVEITDHPLISDIRFPFENTLMDPNDVVVGDQVNLTYVRKLVPADLGETDVPYTEVFGRHRGFHGRKPGGGAASAGGPFGGTS